MDAIFSLAKSAFIPVRDFDCPLTPVIEVDTDFPREIFSSPLIIGASISANLRTLGPADRVLRSLGHQGKVDRIASNGLTARQLIPKLDRRRIYSASIILSVDLFFWDATVPRLSRSIEAMDQIIGMSSVAGVPLLLATVPKVTLDLFQWNRVELNRTLRRRAKAGHCLLLDLDQLNEEILEADGFTVHGRKYGPEAIAPDGIHLSSAGCEFLAQRILEITRSSRHHRFHS